MRYITYFILCLSLSLFTTCKPDEVVPRVKKATNPVLNATISGLVTNRSDKTPLAGILILLKKDTFIIDSIRTPQLGMYQFKVVDNDTFRTYNYSIEIPFNERMVFYDTYYKITQDSIQTKNFASCPAGFLSLNFINQNLTDSINILHSQTNCVDSVDYKIRIQVTSKDGSLGLRFLEGILRGPLRLKPDTFNVFKTANNAIFDVKGFKNGKIIIDRIDTIPVKVGTTTFFTYKY
jgi:hypothetical protein